MRGFQAILFGLSAVVLAGAAQASVVAATQRSSIGAGYTVDWGALGVDQTDVGPTPSVGGVSVSGADTFMVFAAGTSYNADFATGETVLAAFGANPSFELLFSSAVLSAGAQIQSNLFGAFAGLIEAFDSGNNSLGSFAVSGANAGNGDGSAVFAGIVSDAFDIKRLVFSGFGDGAAINALSVGNVPEPGSLALLLAAAAAGVLVRRRQA